MKENTNPKQDQNEMYDQPEPNFDQKGNLVETSFDYGTIVEEAIAKLNKAKSKEECDAVVNGLKNRDYKSEGVFLLTHVAQVLRAHYMAGAFSSSDNSRVIDSAGSLKTWVDRVDKNDQLVQRVVAYYNDVVTPILANSVWMPSDYRKAEKWQV